MFLTVCLNPTIQKTIFLNDLRPGAVNRSQKHYLDISGKGVNVTRVLKSIGEKAIHLTHTGGVFSPFFRQRAKDEGLRLNLVKTETEIRFCVTLIDEKHRTATEIVEDGCSVDAACDDKIRKAYRALLPRSQAVIISGSKAKGYSDSLFPDLVRLAKAAGKFIIADYRGPDLTASLPFAPHLIKPNLTEFIETFFPEADPHDRAPALLDSVREKIESLARRTHIDSVLTDGDRPLMYTDQGEARLFTPAKIEPVNTTGCGDAFAAGFASSFLKNRDLPAAVALATDTARRNALHPRPGFLA